jgi:hypothetical protein
VVKAFLYGGKEVEQDIKAFASLTKLDERYSSEKFEIVCSKVLTHTASPSIRIISTILKSGQDKQKETDANI